MPAPSAMLNPNVRKAYAQLAETAASAPAGPAIHLLKNSLNGGELSPDMAMRFDQPRYQSGCHKLLNMCPLPTGGITRRPGLEAIAMLGRAAGGSLAAPLCRIIPFVFSASESRLLLFEEYDGETSMSVFAPDGSRLGTALELPWPAGVARGFTYCQSADVVFVAHPKIRPGKIMRHADDDWRWEQIAWVPPIEAPTITHTNISSANEGNTTRFVYVVTAVDSETGAESPPSKEAAIYSSALSTTHTICIGISEVPGASEYRVYKKRAGVFGFIGRDTGERHFTDANIQPDTEDTPPEYRDPFEDEGERPAIVFMHQQRLGYASSDRRPLTVWLSQAGNFESMSASTPPEDDDAIEATLAAPQANRILWAQSDRDGLAVGTEGGEWLLTATEGAAITPKDLSFQPQTYFGSQPGLPVLRAGASLLYAQRGGRAIREFGYSMQEDRYSSNDLTLLARHILRENPVASWCWQPEPHGIIWCALANGAMAGLTYLREHEVVAWHRHETAGSVTDVAAIPDGNGGWQVWALVERNTLADLSGPIPLLHVEQDRINADEPAEAGQQETAGPDAWEGNAVWLERLGSFHEGGEWAPGDFLDGFAQLPYQARAIPCVAESQTDAGTTCGLMRKINAVKLRMLNSGAIAIRAIGQDARPGPVLRLAGSGPGPSGTSDWSTPVAGGFMSQGNIEIIADEAAPATILGVVMTLELSDQAGK